MSETKRTPSPSASNIMVVNLGRQRRNRVRQLRRGRGRLMRLVQDAIAEVQHEGRDVEPNQPVVVVVERRRRRSRRRWRSRLHYSPFIGWI